MAAPRGLWVVNHPVVAVFVGLAMLTLLFYAAIAAAIIGAIWLLVCALNWLARRWSR